MKSFNEYVSEYKKQVGKGDIKEAYRRLMEYIMDLRIHFKSGYPEYFVSGNIYQGYMDMTYFSFIPDSLKSKKLKVAIVFIHDTIRFEAWLAGYNKQVQAKYWKLFKDSGWDKYRIPLTTEGVDSIVECILADNPDFNDPDSLTSQIDRGTLKFIHDVETFLSENARLLYLNDCDIHVIDYAGTISFDDALSNMEMIEKAIRKSAADKNNIKVILDLRNTIWENKETHDALSRIARKIFNSDNFDFAVYLAVLNNKIEGPAFENEYWFVQKEDAIRWLAQKS